MKTVRIDGVDYPYYGMTDDRLGIITEDRTFWMFPDCYPDGRPVTELPRIGPREVKPVSFDEPDLTESYLDEVKADYEQYLKYWRTVTPEDHAKEYGLSPGRDPDEDDAAYTERVRQWLEGFRPQFEDGRKRLLAVPFDDFRRGDGKRNAWLRHGTPELAEKNGFREDMNLYLGMYGQRVNREEIIPRILALRFEACYPDPDGTIIYLRTVVPDRHRPYVLRHVLAYRELLSKADMKRGATFENVDAEKAYLRKLAADGHFPHEAVKCFVAYMASGSVHRTAEQTHLHHTQVTEYLKLCESRLDRRVRRERRGGPHGAKKEAYYEDRLATQTGDVHLTGAKGSEQGLTAIPAKVTAGFDYDEIDRRLAEDDKNNE